MLVTPHLVTNPIVPSSSHYRHASLLNTPSDNHQSQVSPKQVSEKPLHEGVPRDKDYGIAKLENDTHDDPDYGDYSIPGLDQPTPLPLRAPTVPLPVKPPAPQTFSTVPIPERAHPISVLLTRVPAFPPPHPDRAPAFILDLVTGAKVATSAPDPDPH